MPEMGQLQPAIDSDRASTNTRNGSLMGRWYSRQGDGGDRRAGVRCGPVTRAATSGELVVGRYPACCRTPSPDDVGRGRSGRTSRVSPQPDDAAPNAAAAPAQQDAARPGEDALAARRFGARGTPDARSQRRT
jgi:hypothetical protein